MKEKTRIMIIIGIVVGVFIMLLNVWAFIHRRAIRAVIFKEKMPACPHWLPGCIRELLIAHDLPD